MKKTIITLILTFTYSFAIASEPAAIEKLADQYGMEIQEYHFKSQNVYLIDQRSLCCDLGAKLYDEDAGLICRYIGIAGAWEPNCSDFDEVAVYKRTIKYGSNFNGEQIPHFELSKEDKKKLVDNVKRIKVGDSYSKVISVLGKPTYEKDLARKEATDKIIGKTLDYYAVIWEKGLVNEIHDELIHIFFDDKEIVTDIYIRVSLD